MTQKRFIRAQNLVDDLDFVPITLARLPQEVVDVVLARLRVLAFVKKAEFA